jgi:hypothetical protein
MIDDIRALYERINEGIEDSDLEALVKFLIPTRDPSRFSLILQQNCDIKSSIERQKRSVSLFICEIGDKSLQAS